MNKCAAKKQEITTTSLGDADTDGLKYKPHLFKMSPGMIKFIYQDHSPSSTTLELELTLSECRFLVKNPQVTRVELEDILDALDKAVWSLQLSESEISSKFSTIFERMNFSHHLRKLVLKVFDEVSENYANKSSSVLLRG